MPNCCAYGCYNSLTRRNVSSHRCVRVFLCFVSFCINYFFALFSRQAAVFCKQINAVKSAVVSLCSFCTQHYREALHSEVPLKFVEYFKSKLLVVLFSVFNI